MKTRVFALAAHPDDIEIGCAGTLIKYHQRGNNVYSLIMTEGQMGGDPKLRKKEQEQSACHNKDIAADITDAVSCFQPKRQFLVHWFLLVHGIQITPPFCKE